MKKFTLFLIATLFSAMSFAALNPYAYGLKSTFDGTTLTANYSLNADATGVSVVILNGETEVHTVACNDKKTKGSHSVNIDISTLGLPTGKSLTWKVVVTGESVASPTLHDESIKFYLPYGMDVDVDPESDYLGNWYVIEAARKSSNQTHSGYHSYEPNKNVRGLYAFDASLTPIKNNSGYYVFYGDINVGGTETNINNDYLNFYRVATSGGRVFIGRFRDGASYHPIVEANPADLNANFTSVFTSGRAVSIDAIGSGENLKLVMLAKDNNIYEYDLGNAKSIAAASRTINKGTLSIARDDATITYDNNGDIWFNQHQGSPTANTPTIAHLSIENGFDWNNVSASISHANTSNSGIAVSPDGKQLAVVGAGTKTITIYNINNTGGNITLTKAYSFTVSAGSNHTALAWDYAGNLFTANRSSECIRIFAMPYSGTVATPCASKYAFSLPAPAQLNPFAYKLSSELSADEKNLTIKYSLNALATSVNWVLMDGETPIKTVDLSTLGLEKGDYTTTISTTDFPQYKQLKWKIEVKGVAVNEPTEYPVNHSIYHPSSVDIDNNPENETFGLLLVNEGMHAVKTKTTHADGSTYISSGFGAGIFAFNPAFENIGKYNGGITFTNTRADGTGTAYSPRRIRISDDGRIFVTSLNTDGNYLWEVNPKNMNEWTTVFKSASINTDKELVDASDSFIVGPNTGFDVKGSGSNLKLMMYSVNLRGITAAHADAFKCAEYNLGNEAEWSTKPSKTWIEGKYAITYNGTQVEYDNEGGFWVASYRGTATNTNPGLVHINKDGVATTFVWNNVRNAGIRFNHDYTKLVVAGYNGAAKKATIYTVSKNASGTPVLTEELVIDMAIVGNNLNDFAWDYAGNLYACGNSNEKLAVWAMPHSSEDVVATPAASKYAFSIGKYTVTVNTNDVNKGTVTGGGEYGAGAVVTLTATPKEGYELLYWSDRSKENPRNITVDGNEALSAYFIKKNDVEPTFSITKVWENTNVPASTSNGYQAVGWDGKIYMQDAGNKKIVTYSSKEDLGTDYVTGGGAGQQIAVDEAGNLIVFNAWFATGTPNAILIYKKGSTEGKAVTFTLLEQGRCDFFSASGNIFSAEGGYVYFYCQNKTVVNRVKITNGAATAADITIDAVGSEIAEGNSQNHVIVDIFGNLMAHSRTNSNTYAINVLTDESKLFVLPNHKYTTLGGCSFELGGKELWAYNVGTTNFNSEWNIYNVTDKENLSNEVLYVKDKTAVGSAANWLNVQVVDEKTAYIYQFCPKVGAAVWKVTRDHIVTATAENGTVEGAGTYKDNATVTLTATPNDGYLFKNWTKNGEVVSTENPYSFTVTEDVELVANFDGPFCELILNTNDENKGTVSGAGFYTQGQTVTIEATPKDGYKLLYWSDRSTENPRNITITKKEALSAYFVKDYAVEPTFVIEKVWENTNVPTSANNGFQAVGWDEKIYMKDRGNKQILVFSDATTSATYVATDDKDDQPIAIDDAGNIIIRSGSGFFYNAPTQVTIYKNGDKTGKVIDFTLPATGRCDFISASGDIYSAEGGYVYFYCQNQTTVSRLYIKNGGASAADVSVDKLDNATLTAGSSQSHVFTNIFGDLMTHTRDNNYKVLQEVNVLTGAVSTMNLPSFKKSTLGGCSFELGGKEFIAYNIAGTDYNSEWNLYNMTDKEFVSAETLYAKDRTSKKTSGAANWLNVQVVDENTAYIYQFCPEVAVAVWKVTCTTEKTVIIDEEADNTTALAPYEGQLVDNATVKRNFEANKCYTLTLPFDMNASQINDVFGNATVYEFYNIVEQNAEELYLEFIPTSSIQAGGPCLIVTPSGNFDANDGFEVENVIISTTLQPVQVGAVTMMPVLDNGYLMDDPSEYYVWDGGLYCAGTYNMTSKGLRAYFTSSSPLPVRARVVLRDNEATSIPLVGVESDNQVRKIMKDGQIIIIRGEEQYNIQGQRID